jgi:hypothetical protein
MGLVRKLDRLFGLVRMAPDEIVERVAEAGTGGREHRSALPRQY